MPEQAEERDEEAEAADLDALLELFREEEEPAPRKRIPGTVWIFLALVFAMVAIWLAARVATGQLAARSDGVAMRPTKSGDRELRDGDLHTGSVVDDYLARCKKGMTAQEVRWIVEDFQKAGLDEGLRAAPPEKFVAQRKAQHAWYLDLLTEGLGLSADQRLSALEKLNDLLAGASESFEEELASKASEEFESGGKHFQIVESGPIHRLISAESWLTDDHYAPWELCELTNEQKRITWFGWFQFCQNAGPGSMSYESNPFWINPDSASIGDPLSDDEAYVADFPTGDAPGEVIGAGTIFPFVLSQKFSKGGEEHAGPLEVQAMGCHPAQLKTSLLIEPDIASRLLGKLDAMGE